MSLRPVNGFHPTLQLAKSQGSLSRVLLGMMRKVDLTLVELRISPHGNDVPKTIDLGKAAAVPAYKRK